MVSSSPNTNYRATARGFGSPTDAPSFGFPAGGGDAPPGMFNGPPPAMSGPPTSPSGPNGPAPSPIKPAAPDYSATNEALQNLINQDQTNADKLNSDYHSFQSNMPAYVGNQVDASTGLAKSNLANDIQTSKVKNNARGLLYSGVNASDQSTAAGNESSKLASQIQSINNSANSLSDQKRQLATSAQQTVASDQVNYQSALAQQQQTLYQQALQEQQNQNAFYGSVIDGGIGLGILASLLFL